jgi:hypothetical protein
MWFPQIPFAFLYVPLKGRVYASTNGNAPSFHLCMGAFFDKHGAPSFQSSMAHLPFNQAWRTFLSIKHGAPSFHFDICYVLSINLTPNKGAPAILS